MSTKTKGNADHRRLDAGQIDAFLESGFVRLDEAFSRATAEEARNRLWRETGCDPEDRTTWTKPVIRLAGYGGGPFNDAVNTPVLRAAFDQLAGAGRWVPRDGLGTFPIRFPHPGNAGDTGWHVDVSFPPDEGAGNASQTLDYSKFRANVRSRGRALLMLFLFSDVGDDDAPTRIRIGSHLAVARALSPYGDAGLDAVTLSSEATAASRGLPETIATGQAGTVYLCHPFLVHAAQDHRGTEPRFLAQPPLVPRETPQLTRMDGDYSPVERAIRSALEMD